MAGSGCYIYKGGGKIYIYNKRIYRSPGRIISPAEQAGKKKKEEETRSPEPPKKGGPIKKSAGKA